MYHFFPYAFATCFPVETDFEADARWNGWLRPISGQALSFATIVQNGDDVGYREPLEAYFDSVTT